MPATSTPRTRAAAQWPETQHQRHPMTDPRTLIAEARAQHPPDPEEENSCIFEYPCITLALADALETALADTERLDSISRDCGGSGWLQWCYVGGAVTLCHGDDGQDLRAALDAAKSKP